MLTWATRLKQGICDIMREAKTLTTKHTVSIWKTWDLDRANEPEKKVDKRRVIQSNQKYKETKVTNTLKVNKHCQSTSNVKDHKERTFQQESFDDYVTKTYVMGKYYNVFIPCNNQ